jgi:hypothetical protein
METFINLYLFPYTAVAFIFKYALAGLGWFFIFMLVHYLFTAVAGDDFTDWKFRNPFYRD